MVSRLYINRLELEHISNISRALAGISTLPDCMYNDTKYTFYYISVVPTNSVHYLCFLLVRLNLRLNSKLFCTKRRDMWLFVNFSGTPGGLQPTLHTKYSLENDFQADPNYEKFVSSQGKVVKFMSIFTCVRVYRKESSDTNRGPGKILRKKRLFF